jgi:uncharacterized protein YuzE
MNFHYDKSVDALAIRFSQKPTIESDEIQPGIIFDYDKSGKVIAIEIIGASKVLSKKEFHTITSKKVLPITVR